MPATALEDYGIFVRNHGCFTDDLTGLETLRPVNILIGRNNAGKSAFLRFLIDANKLNDSSGQERVGALPEVVLSQKLTEPLLKYFFTKYTTSQREYLSYPRHGAPLVGGRIMGAYLGRGHRGTPTIEPSCSDEVREVLDHARNFDHPLIHNGRRFAYVWAERDIRPERVEQHPQLLGDGQGATSLVERFLRTEERDESLIKQTLLERLNRILEPELRLDEITCKQLRSGNKGTEPLFEIFIREQGKRLLPLSASGSGLKSVILVLLNLIVRPVEEQCKLSSYAFIFEEPENNLHPGIQRRLIKHIRDESVSHNFICFISTHSSSMIDVLSTDPQVQLVHVRQTGGKTLLQSVTSYLGNVSILDDLDVRASDLLQSNVVVWLEGPSDRLYFNRLLDLWTGGALREGFHYQCVFYGGKLLSHFTALGTDKSTDKLSFLTVNRHCIVMMDSDKASERARLNITKTRVMDEVTRAGGYVWITAGREVENYLPAQCIEVAIGLKSLPVLGRFEKFASLLKREKGVDVGERFEGSKVQFAREAAPLLSRASILGNLDLEEQLTKVSSLIRQWNSLPSDSL